MTLVFDIHHRGSIDYYASRWKTCQNASSFRASLWRSSNPLSKNPDEGQIKSCSLLVHYGRNLSGVSSLFSEAFFPIFHPCMIIPMWQGVQIFRLNYPHFRQNLEERITHVSLSKDKKLPCFLKVEWLWKRFLRGLDKSEEFQLGSDNVMVDYRYRIVDTATDNISKAGDDLCNVDEWKKS